MGASPVGVFGVIGLLSFALICMMQETLGLPMTEQIVEMEKERRVSQTQTSFIDILTDQ